ncbi:MAG: CDP-alcohol phosphatidyltransferase family protein [bacterium]|nr:CDP-alcohol phosphatidyltransferase family protein [bacterium]
MNKQKFDYKAALKRPGDSVSGKMNMVDMYLNRPVASLIVRAVYNTRVTPNGLTIFSFLLALTGVFFFTRGEYRYFIVGGILAQLSSVVDGADGMLARAKGMGSRFGAYLDLFFDRIIDFSVFVGASYGASLYFNDPFLLFLGTLGAGMYMLQVNLFYLYKECKQQKETGDTGEMRAILYWALLILAIANRLDIFLYLGLAETVLNIFFRTIAFFRLKKEVDVKE